MWNMMKGESDVWNQNAGSRDLCNRFYRWPVYLPFAVSRGIKQKAQKYPGNRIFKHFPRLDIVGLGGVLDLGKHRSSRYFEK